MGRTGSGSVRLVLSAALVVMALGIVVALRPAGASALVPSVGAVWPRSGPTGGGTPLTVVGTGFTGATAVTVDGVPASQLTVVSDTLLRAVTGPAPGGTAVGGSVAVTTPSGTSTASALGSYAYTAGGLAIAAPSYFYPGPQWTQLDAGHPPVDLAVINPNSGPGSAPDPNYAAQVATAQLAGVDVLGYVHTSYGARNLGTVETEVSEYETWYHVNGIFVDEGATSCSLEASYYSLLYTYIHSQPGLDLTVLNPGTATSSCYMAAADVVLSFEGTPAMLGGAGPLPRWAGAYPASRFWGVVYGAKGTSGLASALAQLSADGYGQAYVTDGQLPNPYGALPSYWSQEVADAAGTAGATPPGPGGTTTTTSTTSTTTTSTSTTTTSSTTSTTSTTTTTAVPAQVAPRIVSASSDSVPSGRPFSFTVRATGTPTPALSVSGKLPSTVSFADNGNGTGTLTGSIQRGHSYRLTLSATNGVGRAATQTFTLSASK